MSEVSKSGNVLEEATHSIKPFDDARGQVNDSDAASPATAGDASNASSKTLEVTSPNVDTKKTPTKRTPSKRMSFIERAQKESEELVRNMGGSLELDGGRRTRSSARSTPTQSTSATTPPPTKKARSSPAIKQNVSATLTPSRVRGRGRKIDISITEKADDISTSNSDKDSNESSPTDETKIEDQKNFNKQSEIDAEDIKAKSTPSATDIEESNQKKKDCQSLDKEENVINDFKVETDTPIATSSENNINKDGHIIPIENNQEKKIQSPTETEECAIIVKPSEPNKNTEVLTKEEEQVEIEKEKAINSKSTTNEITCNTEKDPSEKAMEIDFGSINDDKEVNKSADVFETVVISGVSKKIDTVEKDFDDLPTPSKIEENVTKKESDSNVIATKNTTVVSESFEDHNDGHSHALKSDGFKESDKTTKPLNETTSSTQSVNNFDNVPQVNTKSIHKNDETPKKQEGVDTDTDSNKPDSDFCEPKIVSPTTISTSDVPEPHHR